MSFKRLLISVVLCFWMYGYSLAQEKHALKELRIVGAASLVEDQMIADREVNYDVNGNLAAGIWLVTNLQDISITSSLGVIKQTGYEEAIMVYLSPEERVLKILKDGLTPFEIVLSDLGVKLESGEVWQIEIEEIAKGNASDYSEIKIKEELDYLENEIIADRRDNKTKEGILAAGIKIYTGLEKIEVKSSDSDKVLKVQAGKGYWMAYVLPDIIDIQIFGERKKPLTIDLSEITIESGSVYSLFIE